MNNYKIKVNNEAESREAQELFFELGYGFEGCKLKRFEKFEYIYPIYFYAYSDKDLTVSSDDSLFSSKENHREITLLQLRDLVVLHRNDVNDATHSCDGMNGAAININGSWYGYNYFKNEWQLWDEYEDDEYKISDLKPIQKSPEHGLISGADAKLAWAKGEELLIDTGTGFHDLTDNYYLAVFDRDSNKFKRKPRTITLNVEIPAPFEPKDGEIFWFVSPYTYKGYDIKYFVDDCTGFLLNGVWRTEEEIKQVVAALRGGIKG